MIRYQMSRRAGFDKWIRHQFYLHLLRDMEESNPGLSLGDRLLIKDATSKHANHVFEVHGKPILLDLVHNIYCFNNYLRQFGFKRNNAI